MAIGFGQKKRRGSVATPSLIANFENLASIFRIAGWEGETAIILGTIFVLE